MAQSNAAHPTLMLLPGLMCDAAVWAPQVKALSAQVHCVVPSYGLRDSIIAMAEYVLEIAPTPTFALAGHSMGGRIALQVQRLAPQRVDRLALFNTSALPVPAGAAGEREKSGRMALLAMAQRKGMRSMGEQWLRGMVHPSLKTGPVFDGIVDMLERSSPAQFAAQVQALLHRPDATPVLPTIHCPTLVLCGQDDSISSADMHRTMAQGIPGAVLHILQRCGHMSTLEKPTEVNQALQEWLAR